MSVALFSADELANAAAYLLNSHARDMTTAWMRQIIEDLATFSRANALAFERTYRERPEPITVAEISGALLDGRKYLRFACNKDRAVASLRLMRYNCIANDGSESESVEGYESAMLRIFDLFTWILCEELREIRERRAA